MSKFTQYYKDIKMAQSKHTMRSDKMRRGNKRKAREIRLSAPHTKAPFRHIRVKLNRHYDFPVRRVKYRGKPIKFRPKSIPVPRGVKFEGSGLIKAIFLEYGKAHKSRAGKRQVSSKKVKESRLKKESGKTTIRAQDNKREGRKTKSTPPPKSELQMAHWKQEKPVEVEPIQEEESQGMFQAQCYQCYGLIDVEISEPPIHVKCPHCKTKNLFREIPEFEIDESEDEEEEESWDLDNTGSDKSYQPDPTALTMNENGVKLYNQGYYKGALFWFDQAVNQDPGYEEAKRNLELTEKMMSQENSSEIDDN